jgi:hypothetical protein
MDAIHANRGIPNSEVHFKTPAKRAHFETNENNALTAATNAVAALRGDGARLENVF